MSFIDLVHYLAGPQGCNFRTDRRTGATRWDCDHTLARTRRWLGEHGYDVPATVAYLQNLGGYCDCEVLFNAAHHLLSDRKAEQRRA